MNRKITFPELVELVAAKANTSKRVSELFLKEFFATVADALEHGQSVKVKGIGTFKLTQVSARRSVDVNSGTEIEIPGHNKLSFTPSKDMADAINQPFAQFETVVLSPDVTAEQLDAIDAQPTTLTPPPMPQAAEPKEEPKEVEPEPTGEQPTEEQPTGEEPLVGPRRGVAAPTEATEPEPTEPAPTEATEPEPTEPAPTEATEPEPTEEDQPTEDEPKEELQQPISPLVTPPAFNPTVEPEPESPAPEPSDQIEQDLTPEEQDSTPDEQDSTPDEEEQAQEPEDEIQEEDEEEQEQPRRPFSIKWLLIGFVAGLAVAALVAFITHELYMWRMVPVNYAEASSTQVQQATQPDTAAAHAAALAPKSDTAAAKPKPDSAKTAAAKPQPPKVVTDTIKPNLSLMAMSKKHYGNSFFWVYIYAENRGTIKSPNAVWPGQVLVIPPAEKYGIDAKSKASVDKAKRLAAQYYAKPQSKQAAKRNAKQAAKRQKRR